MERMFKHPQHTNPSDGVKGIPYIKNDKENDATRPDTVCWGNRSPPERMASMRLARSIFSRFRLPCPTYKGGGKMMALQECIFLWDENKAS